MLRCVLLAFGALIWSAGVGVHGLYEDQVGKFDWRQQFVGRVRHVLRPVLWQEHQNLIVSTESNVIAGLYLRNGTISWRHILNEPIDFLSSGLEKGGPTLCPVLAVSGQGRFLRCWTNEGLMVGEFTLPQHFFADIDKNSGSIEVLFDVVVDSSKSQLQIVKLDYSKRSIETSLFSFMGSHYQAQSKHSAPGAWFSSSSNCRLISSHLVCANVESLELQVLPLFSKGSDSAVFKQYPLAQFGLKTDKAPRYLCIEKLPYEADKTTTISKSSGASSKTYLSVDLGGEGILVLTLQDSGLDIVKILPDAVKITMIPLMSGAASGSDSSDSSNAIQFGLAVLFAKKNVLKFEREEDGKNGERVFAAKLVIFHMEKWTEIAALSSEQILLEFGDKNSVSPVVSTGKLVKRLDTEWSIAGFEILPIRISSHNPRAQRTQQRYTYKMLLTTTDGSTIVMNLSGKINWAREEALAEIVSAQMLDLPLSETDASIEQEYSHKENILESFITRINTQVSQLNSLVKSIQRHFFSSKSGQRRSQKQNEDLDFSTVADDDEHELQGVDDEEDEDLVRDYFGIHKVVILRTKIGRIFAMDSLSSRIYWSKYEPLLEVKASSASVKLPIYVQRTSAHYPFEAICTILSESAEDPSAKSLLYSFNPFNGRVLAFEKFNSAIVQALQVHSVHDTVYRRPLLFLDSQHQVRLYPDNKELFLSVASKYYMMVANRSSNTLSGFSFGRSTSDALHASPVWSFKLPTSSVSSLKVVFKRDHEQVHSQGKVLGDRRVLYKYSNPNMVAVIWESVDGTDGKPQITLYLLDAVTGNVLHSVIHRRARAPLQIVHSENWVLYSFYNEKMRRNEIATIEMYEGLEQVNSTAFSSIDRDLLKLPIIQQQSFIFPTGITFMTDTETQKGITHKHILIALPTGGLLELPRQFLDPRRPIRPTKETQEEGLIPYIPELPVPSEALINYNQTIFGVRGIQVAPTSLESTSLVFAYGLDVFYARVTPSKTFDILKDDFDFLLITFVLIALTVASYLAKFVADKKSLNLIWK